MKKYEILKRDFINMGNFKVYRIRALRDLYNVKAGDLGGYVESEKNLSHEGNAWVADEAMVVADAKVLGDALVADFAIISNNSIISGNAIISGWVQISGNAKITGNTLVTCNAPYTSKPALRQ